ncbi:hypothetical protein [Methylocucumis oryzae]|uniref:hypothetical protein n=1 Tax=Methylocucumis oryzae TaxID=1632867 RepID=UPI000696524A|nr:hypothetical protein [Methylocucumis oryzae]
MNAIEQAVSELHEQGYTIVNNVLTASELTALDQDLLRLEHELNIKPGVSAFEGYQTLRVHNLLTHGVLYQRLPVHEKNFADYRSLFRSRLFSVIVVNVNAIAWARCANNTRR